MLLPSVRSGSKKLIVVLLRALKILDNSKGHDSFLFKNAELFLGKVNSIRTDARLKHKEQAFC